MMVNSKNPMNDILKRELAEAKQIRDDIKSEEDVLEEALRLTSGDRQNSYGPPDQDFDRTARMWTALKGVDFSSRDVALFMIALKLSRETHQRKRDNAVDIAGYARCLHICNESEKEKAP